MIEALGELLTKIREENLNVYRASGQRLREDVGQEAQIAQDYRGRLIYELLQNADDAMSSSSTDTAAVEFLLDDDSLWVANSGRPLDEGDIRGLCGVSASSKSMKYGGRRASIGHKGMGFKSVLEISDAPEVYSTTICLGFVQEKALAAVRELGGKNTSPPVDRAPITRFPWKLETEPVCWAELRARGMHTAFRFPFRSRMTLEHRIGLARVLREIPVTSLVFLKHLARVAVSIRTRDENHSFAWNAQRRNLNSGEIVGARCISVDLTSDSGESESFVVAHNEAIEIGNFRGGLDDFAWDGVEVTEVSVGARVRDSRPIALNPSWRRLHVFLPTVETSPYDLLVSGAFATNLSRQEIRIENDTSNYNRFLLRSAARLLTECLIPSLLSAGAAAADVLQLLDRKCDVNAVCTNASGQALFEEVRGALQDLSFLPLESGGTIAISACVVPPIVGNADLGYDFRALLALDASFEGRYFPSNELCRIGIGRVLVDHGARVLSPQEAAIVLADPDPARSRLDISKNVFVDPVLRTLQNLWLAYDAVGRRCLADVVRSLPLFPIGVADDETAHRVKTDGVTCFYPPRSLRGNVPLGGLCFLMQEICWGDLAPKDRNEKLRLELTTWQALFNVQEFKFPAVMQASVLPALTLDMSDRRERESLRTIKTIAAICQLSGRTPNANAPLPYQRLEANRALFNLSRLDLPCRRSASGNIVWVPAYRVYLGADWIGDASVERVLERCREVGIKNLPEVHFLAEPDAFSGLLAENSNLCEIRVAESNEPGADEVSVEEDDEAALEGNEHARWLAFFLWLGVNQSLRPVHFHDVEDMASGWLKTANLQRPEGWIFKYADSKIWNEYVVDLQRQLSGAMASPAVIPYFYRLHDLEHLVVLLEAASVDESAKIGQVLYEHLARNWATLERFSKATIALVASDNVPGMRRKPPRARDDELHDVGPDFWLARLQEAPFCPTGHGPRRAAQTWLPTIEVERRFGRRGVKDSFLVPALKADAAVLKGKAKGFAQALGVREELTAANFTLEDARGLLIRLRDLFKEDFDAAKDMRQQLSNVIKPAYRNLFELLSGRDAVAQNTTGSASLADAPLLAGNRGTQFRFFEDRSFYYLERHGTLDRLDSTADIWSFVIEASPGARAPIVQLFGVRILEESLRWTPRPGDVSLGESDLECLRKSISELAPYVLSRIAVDRADETLARLDAQRLRRFVDCIEPVTDLELGCTLDGHDLVSKSSRRNAFVFMESDKPRQAFIVWGESPWPPDPGEAETLADAICDVFGSRYFESILALIHAKSPEDRERLLRRAGAPIDLDERRALFLGVDSDVEVGTYPHEPSFEPRSIVATVVLESPAIFPGDSELQSIPGEVQRTPLYSPQEILIEGEPVQVLGEHPSRRGNDKSQTDEAGSRSNGHRQPGGGYGGHTDLDALNKIGMSVTLSYERQRLRRSGLEHAEIFYPSVSETQQCALVFDVSTPDLVALARAKCKVFEAATDWLNKNFGISLEWPGFDVLTLDSRDGKLVNRMIELKSSGVASRVQAMSWNEWKTAGSSLLRSDYYLYLVGNLRSDLNDAVPFIRIVRNPFEQLFSEVRVNNAVSRKIQLAVDQFREAEHLELSIIPKVTAI